MNRLNFVGAAISMIALTGCSGDSEDQAPLVDRVAACEERLNANDEQWVKHKSQDKVRDELLERISLTVYGDPNDSSPAPDSEPAAIGPPATSIPPSVHAPTTTPPPSSACPASPRSPGVTPPSATQAPAPPAARSATPPVSTPPASQPATTSPSKPASASPSSPVAPATVTETNDMTEANRQRLLLAKWHEALKGRVESNEKRLDAIEENYITQETVEDIVREQIETKLKKCSDFAPRDPTPSPTSLRPRHDTAMFGGRR